MIRGVGKGYGEMYIEWSLEVDGSGVARPEVELGRAGEMGDAGFEGAEGG